MASSLYSRALKCIACKNKNCVPRHWFWHWSWHFIDMTESCPFLMQWCLRAWKSWAFNIDFQPCAVHRFCRFYSTYHLLLIVCTDEISKMMRYLWFNVRRFFWNCFTIWKCSFLRVSESADYDSLFQSLVFLGVFLNEEMFFFLKSYVYSF